MDDKFNPNSTAIRRIRADMKEFRKPDSELHAAPVEGNLFDWHFTIRGPADTEFDGGLYHGRIVLPTEYPFKPPNILLLTPSGRFEVRTKICLSISHYHPESWSPAWGIRLILEALISFMPSPGEGAIGALDYTPEERKRLAIASQTWECPVCGPIKDLLPERSTDAPRAHSKYADEIAKLHIHAAPNPLETPKPSSMAQSGPTADADSGSGAGSGASAGAGAGAGVGAASVGTGSGEGQSASSIPQSSTPSSAPTASAESRPSGSSSGGAAAAGSAPAPPRAPPAPVVLTHPGPPSGDRCLGVVAGFLFCAIILLILRKLQAFPLLQDVL